MTSGMTPDFLSDVERDARSDVKVMDRDDDDDDDDDVDEGGVGERMTTSASSPSKYARQFVANAAAPITKSQVWVFLFIKIGRLRSRLLRLHFTNTFPE